MPNHGPDNKSDHPGVIAPPPLIYLGFLGAAYPLGRVWPLTVTPPYWPALVLAGVGIVVALAAMREFHRAKTHVAPHKPTVAIVTSGPFAYSRNPLYVVLALFHMAIALAWGNVWALLLLVPALLVIRYGVIAREEGYLEAKFGAEYLAYKDRVRRWL